MNISTQKHLDGIEKKYLFEKCENVSKQPFYGLGFSIEYDRSLSQTMNLPILFLNI